MPINKGDTARRKKGNRGQRKTAGSGGRHLALAKPRASGRLESDEYPEWVEADLRKSGLYEISKMLGIEYLDAYETQMATGMLVESYRLPYFDLFGNYIKFCRYRFKEPINDQKYHQKKGTGSKLYLPPNLKGGWQAVADDPKRLVAITEGEKKSARGCAAELAVIGVSGISSWSASKDIEGRSTKRRLLPDFKLFKHWPERSAPIIILDSDQATNPTVAEEALKLCCALRDELECAAPRVVRLKPGPKGEKVGLDDFLEHEGNDERAVKKLLDMAERVDDRELTIAKLNERYIKVVSKGKVFDKQERAFLSRAGFELATAHYSPINMWAKNSLTAVPAAVFWINSKDAHRTDRMTFRPGRPELLEEGYNLWRADVIPQAIEGDVQPFYDFLDHLGICGPLRDAFLSWCAWPIVRTEYIAREGAAVVDDKLKIFWAVIITGAQGSGKTLLGELIGSMYDIGFRAGIYNNAFLLKKGDDLVARFNSRMVARQYVLADEIMGINKREIANTLKSGITGTTIDIEPKGVDTYTMPNYMNLFCASNAISPVWYDKDERRYFHHRIESGRLENNRPLWNNLLKWYKETRLSGPNLRYHFLHDAGIKRLLKNFDPERAPAETPSLAEARETSHSDLEAALERLRLKPTLAFQPPTTVRKLWTLTEILDVVDRIMNKPGSSPGRQYRFLNARVKPYVNLKQSQALLKDGDLPPRFWVHVNDVPALKKLTDRQLTDLWEAEHAGKRGPKC